MKLMDYQRQFSCFPKHVVWPVDRHVFRAVTGRDATEATVDPVLETGITETNTCQNPRPIAESSKANVRCRSTIDGRRCLGCGPVIVMANSQRLYFNDKV